MKKISNDVGILFRCQIYLDTIPKIIRGMAQGIFFNKKEGLLFVGKKVKITNRQNIEVGRNVKFESHSEIQGLANEKIIFGNNVTIGKGVQIRPSSYYGVGHIGDGLVIEDNSSIGPNGFIGCAGKVKIGKQVMIGPNVTIIAENHNFNDQNMAIKNQGVHQKGVNINDNVWIGANVTILDGVTIHSNTVIGANTLITKDIPSNTVFYNKRTPILKER